MEQKIKGLSGFDVVIGIEIHAHINSKTKLFSRSPNHFGDKPNENVSGFDMAIPGSLPLLNKECVKKAVKTGLAIDGKINKLSVFERKHYFYPDLPSGYQISQLRDPIVTGGYIQLESGKKIKINRIQLEQDAGKNIHDIDKFNSYIDLNRAGCPLMEIVSEPDINSILEAEEYIRKMIETLKAIKTSDANLEKGEFRMDVNVSINRPGEPLGNRVEIKNLNSVRFMKKAVENELERQAEIINSGEKVDQETRLYNVKTGETEIMRKKENESEYQYFKCPDLNKLVLDDTFIEEIRSSIEELPAKKLARVMCELNLNKDDTELIINEDISLKFIQDTFKLLNEKERKIMFNFFNTFIRALESFESIVKDINTEHMALVIKMIDNNTISNSSAKKVFTHMIEEKISPDEVVKKYNYAQVCDVLLIEKEVDLVIKENPVIVQKYRDGKKGLIGFLTGKIMQKFNNNIDAKTVNKLFVEKLG